MGSDVYSGTLIGLSFSFPVYVGTMFCLAILAVGLNNDPFSLVYTEERQEQLIHFMSTSLDDNSGHGPYHGRFYEKSTIIFLLIFFPTHALSFY
jgi:hypothetical protein